MEKTENPHLPVPKSDEVVELSPGHARFVHFYCHGGENFRPFNKSQSALAAGYSAPQYATELMRRDDVTAAIDQELRRSLMSGGEVLQRLAEIARGEVGQVVVKDDQTGLPAFDTDKLMELRHLISEFGYDSNGLPKVKFHDAHAALKDIGRALKLFTDNIDTTLSGNVNVAMEIRFVDSEEGGAG